MIEQLNQKHAVIFDLFHTLVSLRFTKDGKMTHEMLGVSEKQWNDNLFGNVDKAIGFEQDPFIQMKLLTHLIDQTISDELIRETTEKRQQRFNNALINIPNETVIVLQALKKSGKKLGLISNAYSMEVAAWDRSPIASLFDTAIFSCHDRLAKPDPAIYNLCLDRLGVSAGDVLYVGDGGSNELEGAQTVGLTTVMITRWIAPIWPDKIKPRLPYVDFVIEKLEELVR